MDNTPNDASAQVDETATDTINAVDAPEVVASDALSEAPDAASAEEAAAPVEPAPEPVEVAADDELRDPEPDVDALSEAPARPHQGLVDQMHIRWYELKDFVRSLDGDVGGELGEVLALARKYL